MTVVGRDLVDPVQIWADHPCVPKLKQTIKNILAVCKNHSIVFNADRAKLDPIMQKWNRCSQDAQGGLGKNDPFLAGGGQNERPHIGQSIEVEDIDLLKECMPRFSSLPLFQTNKIDKILS